MKKIIAFLGETLFVIVVTVLCSLIFAVSKGYHPSLFGYQILRVLTESMMPTLEENTLILIKEVPQADIHVGDIITFVSEDPTLLGFYNTHRVSRIERDPDTGQEYYITKGDINTLEDLYPVYYEDVAGELVCVLPLGTGLGRAMVKMADNRVYFFAVMLPLLLCLVSYIWQIFHILLLEDRPGELSESQEEQDEEDEEQ
ncbi:MAG: signal peptidase I [Lachnospiraceae bacterium]|nr:signal peptidase I [Lachnospiraceae bacterium]